MNTKKRYIVGMLAIVFQAPANAESNSIERGKYLSTAADCYACHTAPGGEPYAGGLPFKTPFGTVYSTNITPSKDNGIGNYTFEDFSGAIHDGTSPKGNLYAAMPYTSFVGMTTEDTIALYDYFMTIDASEQPNRENNMMFPANIRAGLKVWNLVNHQSQEEALARTQTNVKSHKWQRGEYVLNTLGHCGECHTPRNIMMAIDKDRHYEGAMIGDVWAPNITADSLLENGWSSKDVKELLSTGYSRKGTVVGEMYTAVYHSLSKFNNEDLESAAIYLLNSDKENLGKSLIYNKLDASTAYEPSSRIKEGRETYLAFCSTCHGVNGEGKPGFAPGMQGNGTLAQSNYNNTFSSILYGIKPQYYSQTVAFNKMDGFNRYLNDEDLQGLINYLNYSFTNKNRVLSKERVSEIRTKVMENKANATH